MLVHLAKKEKYIAIHCCCKQTNLGGKAWLATNKRILVKRILRGRVVMCKLIGAFSGYLHQGKVNGGMKPLYGDSK